MRDYRIIDTHTHTFPTREVGRPAILMAGLLARLVSAITVLMIEHDMDIALELSPHVTVLHYGCVIADGPRAEVRRDPQVREIYLLGA